MEFYRIWRILLGHKWLMVGLPLFATFVGVATSYLLPQQYDSTALVLVRPIREIDFDRSGADRNQILDLPVNVTAPIDAPSKTYMQLIKSHAVAVRIVQALKLYEKPPKHYAGTFQAIKDELRDRLTADLRSLKNYLKYGHDIAASPFELAVQDVEENLVVSARKDTYVFDIAYRATDPDRAAAVVNMAAEIFLEQSSEAYRRESAHTREFIGQQVEESRKALERARAATLAYKKAGSTFDLKQEYDDELKNLADLESSLAKAKGKLANLESLRFDTSPNVAAQEAEIASLQQQISMLRKPLTAYPTKQAQLDSIMLAERLAQDSYSFLVKQYDEAQVKEAADVAEIRIVSRAQPGLYPVKPVKWVYASVSFATALMAAIGWALFSESLDPRIRTVYDLEDGFGVPVLGVIPKLKHF